jgi:hypothetical protein
MSTPNRARARRRRRHVAWRDKKNRAKRLAKDAAARLASPQHAVYTVVTGVDWAVGDKDKSAWAKVLILPARARVELIEVG